MTGHCLTLALGDDLSLLQHIHVLLGGRLACSNLSRNLLDAGPAIAFASGTAYEICIGYELDRCQSKVKDIVGEAEEIIGRCLVFSHAFTSACSLIQAMSLSLGTMILVPIRIEGKPLLRTNSTDKKAIEKQIEVIKTIKAKGAEVLMSAHVLKYIPCERVLEIALSQQERGADIVKIVTEANSETELMDNIKTSIILTEQLSVPALFLCNGTHCKKHRILGPVLNNSPFLVVENSYEGQNQPTIQRAREQLILSGYTNLP